MNGRNPDDEHAQTQVLPRTDEAPDLDTEATAVLDEDYIARLNIDRPPAAPAPGKPR